MGADLSRVRFDALRDHSGVVMQQGRLLLDADWNELVAINDRRLRAAAADLGSPGTVDGSRGVAVVPRTTPDAFRITSFGGSPVIGRGRMYVDGLLAENHGTGPAGFDPLLACPVREDDTPYDDQPYWPVPDALPESGTHLVYLDVWQRELTQVEAPDLVESAVAVDTTARVQTAWQVRVHAPDTPDVDCSTPDEDIPGWPEVTAPSAGRLTTGTVPVPPDEDPCSLPPAGGFRGLENQTYRVEIHDGGASGTATFSWSRDNGSVAVPVVEVVGASRLRPSDLGRDAALGLRTDDWVEILDDHRELGGRPGEMRRITVHDDDGTVSFSPALPADLPATTAEATARHLRIRRWDQSGQVKSAAGAVLADLDAPGSPGVVTVPGAGTAVVLEHGVTVELDAPGGVFRTGDHWIFSARTGTSSVEALEDAPPLGVHHHYARLGVIVFDTGGTDSGAGDRNGNGSGNGNGSSFSFYDCRTPWPDCDGGCGDCTVCVTPESHASGAMTIQDAVDQVAETGGTVCLGPGVYHLSDEPVRIDYATSVRVRGQGPRTLVLAKDGAFDVTRSAFVTLEDFSVIAEYVPAVRLSSTVEATVNRLAVVMYENTETRRKRDRRRDADDGDGGTSAAFELSGVSLLTRITDNDVIARTGVSTDRSEGASPLVTAGLEISGNVLASRRHGVDLGGPAAHVFGNEVRGNTVLGPFRSAVRCLGALTPGASFEIAGNTLDGFDIGVETGPDGYSVRDNEITNTGGSTYADGHGIAVVPGRLGVLRGATRITGNRVHGIGGTGITVRAPVLGLDVSGNRVEGALCGIVVEERGRAADATVSGNVLRQLGSTDQSLIAGVQVVGALRARVRANTVTETGLDPAVGDPAVGVRVLGCPDTYVGGNTVEGIGRNDTETQASAGIHVGVFARALVESNTARRTPLGDDDTQTAGWTGLRIGDQRGEGGDLPVHHGGGYIAVPGTVSHLIGPYTAFALRTTDADAIVTGNAATGSVGGFAARVRADGNAVVSGNRFEQPDQSEQAALTVQAGSATVATNRARGGIPSMRLRVVRERLAVLGNITSNGIDATGGLDPTWVPLNVDHVT